MLKAVPESYQVVCRKIEVVEETFDQHNDVYLMLDDGNNLVFSGS